MAGDVRIVRLGPSDREVARTLFATMAAVFEEELQALGDGYVDRLLARRDFWALAAFAGDRIAGGLTAYTLPMTGAESSEVFIYDIAVRAEHRRMGVGRQLVAALRDSASGHGISGLFVAADNDDVHALDFYRALGGAAHPVTLFTFER